MGVELRKFEKSDFLNLASISNDVWKPVHCGLAESMLNATGEVEQCVLALDGTEIIGYIYGFALPNKKLIPEFLYVLPAYRGGGIGKMLVKELESSTDCTASMIYYNKSLHNYYSEMGYQVGDAVEVAMKEIRSRERASK